MVARLYTAAIRCQEAFGRTSSQGSYVAQTLVRLSERLIKIDEIPQVRNMDVRLYNYSGQVLLVAARATSPSQLKSAAGA